MTFFKSFTYRGWYCTIDESAWIGYHIEVVAMTKLFIQKYSTTNGYEYASQFKECGEYHEFKVTQFIMSYDIAAKKAKRYIDENLGDAPIY